MLRLLLRWVLMAVSVIAASLVTQMLGLGFRVHSANAEQFMQLMLGVLLLALLNATLGRVLKLMTLPLNCMTLGLFSLVVNALVLWLAATFELGFSVEGDSTWARFSAAFVASILIAIINGILGSFVRDRDADD